MSNLNNPDYLLNQQYKNGANLNARVNLHARFSTNPYGWFHWVFDHYHLFTGCQVLELGCGTGETWKANLARIPSGCDIILSDFSAGMLDQARQNLAGSCPFAFEVIDAQSIPYADARFDIVIANHMLYHVPDRKQALAEIRRVLKPGGTLFATTIGGQHLQEMFALPYRFDPERAVDQLKAANEFLLENGAAQLQAFFQHVEMERYPELAAHHGSRAAGGLFTFQLSVQRIRGPAGRTAGVHRARARKPRRSHRDHQGLRNICFFLKLPGIAQPGRDAVDRQHDHFAQCFSWLCAAGPSPSGSSSARRRRSIST